MKALKAKTKKLKNAQLGQGMTEYILLVVVVVGIAFLFKDKIRGAVSNKMDSVSGEIQGFSSQ